MFAGWSAKGGENDWWPNAPFAITTSLALTLDVLYVYFRGRMMAPLIFLFNIHCTCTKSQQPPWVCLACLSYRGTHTRVRSKHWWQRVLLIEQDWTMEPWVIFSRWGGRGKKGRKTGWRDGDLLDHHVQTVLVCLHTFIKSAMMCQQWSMNSAHLIVKVWWIL